MFRCPSMLREVSDRVAVAEGVAVPDTVPQEFSQRYGRDLDRELNTELPTNWPRECSPEPGNRSTSRQSQPHQTHTDGPSG